MDNTRTITDCTRYHIVGRIVGQLETDILNYGVIKPERLTTPAADLIANIGA